MAKRKGKIKLIKGNFYPVRDGSKRGHPGYLYNSNNGIYDSVITGTTKTKHNIEIHPTDKRVQKSFIKKRPFRGTRSDYGNKVYSDMAFDEYSMKKAEQIMKKTDFEYGYHYKNKK